MTRETEIYPPIKKWLEAEGFEVTAEVKDCDIVARKGTELVVVELKVTINLTLLVQATRRQSITPNVYVAVPEPRRKGTQFRGIVSIIKRLGLGLLLVRQGAIETTVKVMAAPSGKYRLNSRRRNAVIKEIDARSGDFNIGGSTGKPIVTAYRERAIYVACCLLKLGELSPAQLRRLGADDKVATMLRTNHYAWFQRVRHGVYELTSRGRRDLADYPTLTRKAKALVARRRGVLDPP